MDFLTITETKFMSHANNKSITKENGKIAFS